VALSRARKLAPMDPSAQAWPLPLIARCPLADNRWGRRREVSEHGATHADATESETLRVPAPCSSYAPRCWVRARE